jgi:hypothetical protein
MRRAPDRQGNCTRTRRDAVRRANSTEAGTTALTPLRGDLDEDPSGRPGEKPETSQAGAGKKRQPQRLNLPANWPLFSVPPNPISGFNLKLAAAGTWEGKALVDAPTDLEDSMRMEAQHAIERLSGQQRGVGPRCWQRWLDSQPPQARGPLLTRGASPVK